MFGKRLRRSLNVLHKSLNLFSISEKRGHPELVVAGAVFYHIFSVIRVYMFVMCVLLYSMEFECPA